MDPKLLKVPRVDLDDDQEYVLLHIAPTGKKTLDLELIGTDNETAFVYSCKVSRSAGRASPWSRRFMH